MRWRCLVFLLAMAGCGEVIGIRELGVERLPSSDGGLGDGCSVSDVTGHWTGTSVTTSGLMVLGAGPGHAELQLQQDCAQITGSMSVDGCVNGGKVVATIDDGGVIEGTVTSGTLVVTVKAALSTPNQLKGDYATVQKGDNCYVLSGTLQLDRQ